MKLAHFLAVPLGFLYAFLPVGLQSCDRKQDNTDPDTQATSQETTQEPSDEDCRSVIWVKPDPDSDLLTKTWPENRQPRDWSELSEEEKDRYMKCMDNLFKDFDDPGNAATWYGPSSCPGVALKFPENRHDHSNNNDDAALIYGPPAVPEDEIIITNDFTKTVVTGALDRRVAQKILRNHFDELRACVKEFKTQSENIPPNFNTDIFIRLDISKEGSVTNVKLVSTDWKLPLLEACFQKNIEAWRYPKRNEDYKVIYRIQLRLPNKDEIDQAKKNHPIEPPPPWINLR